VCGGTRVGAKRSAIASPSTPGGGDRHIRAKHKAFEALVAVDNAMFHLHVMLKKMRLHRS
jgi:hypothetical protein